jgi:hypothetical protein
LVEGGPGFPGVAVDPATAGLLGVMPLPAAPVGVAVDPAAPVVGRLMVGGVMLTEPAVETLRESPEESLASLQPVMAAMQRASRRQVGRDFVIG